jgi:hypothetical protein
MVNVKLSPADAPRSAIGDSMHFVIASWRRTFSAPLSPD